MGRFLHYQTIRVRKTHILSLDTRSSGSVLLSVSGYSGLILALDDWQLKVQQVRLRLCLWQLGLTDALSMRGVLKKVNSDY